MKLPVQRIKIVKNSKGRQVSYINFALKTPTKKVD